MGRDGEQQRVRGLVEGASVELWGDVNVAAPSVDRFDVWLREVTKRDRGRRVCKLCSDSSMHVPLAGHAAVP